MRHPYKRNYRCQCCDTLLSLSDWPNHPPFMRFFWDGRQYFVHTCEDGNWGVAEFIGKAHARNEEKKTATKGRALIAVKDEQFVKDLIIASSCCPEIIHTQVQWERIAYFYLLEARGWTNIWADIKRELEMLYPDRYGMKVHNS